MKNAAAAVFSTKKELYEFMVVELGYYLPPIACVNIEWLRDIATGAKKVRPGK